MRVFRFAICFLLCLTGCPMVVAVPAYPYKVIVRVANGKSVDIYMRGDEHQKFAVSDDGYTLISNSEGWWYATLQSNGDAGMSTHKLVAHEDEGSELKRFKSECPKGILPKRVQSPKLVRASGFTRASATKPVTGERRSLVILMQYPDLAFIKTKEDFNALFNSEGYHVDGAIGSVRDYYRFASQGQLEYVSDIYGPFTAKNPMRYYGGNSTNGGSDAHALDLCIEAMKCLPSDLDYTLYDNDNDGVVDNVHIIFAGYGEEAGGSTDAIWAHEYPRRIPLKNDIGYSLAGYSCSPELRGNQGSAISNIGVICHELGHALGAMDYYDTNYGTGGEYVGTGDWDIMASGSWNDNGRTPPNFNPYVRSEVFGWNQQEVLTPNRQYTMPGMELDNAEDTKVYRMETGSNGDYFLLENRQQKGFDAALPGSGLMIYHVHPNIDRLSSTNTVNATHPQGLYPVCASYSAPNKRLYGNINSAECPFPGSANVKSFTPESIPAAVAWNGGASTVLLQGITWNTLAGTISFTTERDEANSNEPDATGMLDTLYQESFENSLEREIDITSIQGSSMWEVYEKGDFVLGVENIPNPTDGKKMLMLYSRKSNVVSESEAVGPYIAIKAGKNYSLLFDKYVIVESGLSTPKFSLYVEDEYGEYNVYSKSEIKEDWLRVEIPLVFAGNKFRYKLYGQITSGGIFIDNLCLLTELESSTGMSSWSSDYDGDLDVYSLKGFYLGKYDKCCHRLPPGLYLICKGGRIRKLNLK